MSKCTPTGDTGLPSVSMIVLTYGNFDGLACTVDSILLQDYPISQVILSDDGSGRAFPEEAVQKLRAAFPLTLRRGVHNLGTVAHMNTTAALTETEWVKFLSPGDAFSDAGALCALVSFAQSVSAAVVTSQAQVCDETLQRRFYRFPGRRGQAFQQEPPQLFQSLAEANLVSAAGTLFNRRFFTEWGGFDQQYRLLEDWPAWLRLTRGGEPLPLLDRVTCLYGMGGVSSQSMDAFGAAALRPDMLRCYENEILPYLDGFDSGTSQHIRYGYDRLRGIAPEELLARYGWLERVTRWKQSVKRCLLRCKGR